MQVISKIYSSKNKEKKVRLGNLTVLFLIVLFADTLSKRTYMGLFSKTHEHAVLI